MLQILKKNIVMNNEFKKKFILRPVYKYNTQSNYFVQNLKFIDQPLWSDLNEIEISLTQ